MCQNAYNIATTYNWRESTIVTLKLFFHLQKTQCFNYTERKKWSTQISKWIFNCQSHLEQCFWQCFWQFWETPLDKMWTKFNETGNRRQCITLSCMLETFWTIFGQNLKIIWTNFWTKYGQNLMKPGTGGNALRYRVRRKLLSH